MEDLQVQLSPDQKEKLLRYICQVAVIHNHLIELEEMINLDCDLHNDVVTTGFHVHTVKVKLMNLVVP